MTVVKRLVVTKVCKVCLVKLTAKNKSKEEKFICINCMEKLQSPSIRKRLLKMLANQVDKLINKLEGNK